MDDSIGGVDGGSAGPHDPAMEIRVAHPEEDFRDIKGILRDMDARIDARMRAIEVGIAELRGRIQNLPTAWLMLTAIIGGQITLAGLLFAALRFGSH
ncbi:MAG: hypothetical protein ABI369_06260 [Acetobacteraceae bacterium]